MKTRIISIVLTISIMVPGEAKHVSQNIAQQVAEQFMFQKTGKWEMMESLILPDSLKEIYLFRCKDKSGFVFVPSDDCIIPILGYSIDSYATGEMPEPVYYWMLSIEKQIEQIILQGGDKNPKVADRWRRLLSGNSICNNSTSTPITPLLTTRWGQGQYYNDMCPRNGTGELAAVGCGAVAMAQIMKYYNWPDTGVGTTSYVQSTYGNISVSFDTVGYDWANMPTSLSNTSTIAEVNAVAKLMYHAGIAAHMAYGTSSSSSDALSDGTFSKECIENALINHFKYSPGLHSVYRAQYTESEWSDILLSELTSSRPNIYRGTYNTTSAHIWVCDGVDEDNLFHFNFGWHGHASDRYSGYYPLGNLQLTSPVFTSNVSYDKRQVAIIGIRPDSICYSNNFLVSSQPNTTNYGTTSVRLKSTYGTGSASGYFNCGDSIIVSAIATDSTRFVRWNDGCIFSTREEIVKNDINYVALYELVRGDTLYYDNGCYDFYHRRTAGRRPGSSAQPSYWGIKLLPDALVGHDSLKSIMIFDYFDGGNTCNLYIYSGMTTSTSNLIYQQQDTLYNSINWRTINLITPVPIDPTQPLWIVAQTTANSRQAAPFSGNTNGFLCSSNGIDWYSNADVSNAYTWMLRGIFSQGDSANVLISTNNVSMGTVTGNGRYPYGCSTIITAIPRPCFRFSHWSDGDTTNPRSISIVQDTTLSALFIPTMNNSTEDVTACDCYTWHGNTYTSSTNTPTYSTTNAAGCDSTVTLHLTINHSTASIESVTACDSYTWHGTTYTASTLNSQFSTLNSQGCDSTVTLHLTIHHSNSGDTTATACDSFTWWNSNYTNSTNGATHMLTNAAGCDSTVTLHLTIHHSDTSRLAETVCQGDSVLFGSSWLRTGGVYADTLRTALGCDSVVLLTLTVNPVSESTFFDTACDSYTWHDSTYTASTFNSQFSTLNYQGCDSIIHLALTVNYSTRDTIVDSAAGSYLWQGDTYTESGDYLYEGQTTAGCDSVVVLRLTITQVGISAPDSLRGIRTYPNPTRGMITVEGQQMEGAEVFDAAGRRVAQFDFEGCTSKATIDIRHLPAGAYTLRISLADGHVVRRMLKR